MEIIDWEDEFRPLDENGIDFLLNLASQVMELSESEKLNHDEKSLLQVAHHQILRLTAMSGAGYELYTGYRDVADHLRDDLIIASSLLSLVKLGVDMPTFGSLEKFDELIDWMNTDGA